MAQKCIISGGGWQDAEGSPLALGTVQVYLQQDIEVSGVQLCAGHQRFSVPRFKRKRNRWSDFVGACGLSGGGVFRKRREGVEGHDQRAERSVL